MHDTLTVPNMDAPSLEALYADAKKPRETLEKLTEYLKSCLNAPTPEGENKDEYSAIMATCAALASASSTASTRRLASSLSRYSIIGSFTRAWDGTEGPIRLTRWENMLDVNLECRFNQVVPLTVIDFLKMKAREKLAEDKLAPAASDVQRRHWEMLASGHLPFGYKEA